VQSLDPRVVTLWRLQAVVGIATGWAPPLAVLAWFSVFKLDLGVQRSALLLLGCVAVLGVRALVWPGLQYRAFRYALRDRDLLVEQGVLWRQSVCVPRDRVQYVDTRQGPLERLVGLSRLLVFTASGLNADASLPGLDEQAAARLREELAHGDRRDDGV
jgi:membrane protein YdbS with pleckstrin-like domain